MSTEHKTSPADPVEILSVVLDRPIAFHPVFADITGSVLAGLLLSQAVYWTKRAASGGWFYKTIIQWQEETRLSRHEQDTARKALRKFSFWQEERRGVPAKMFYRVDLSALYQELVLLNRNQSAQSSLPESGNLDCRNAANKHDGKRQTRLPETDKHNKGVTETTTEITSKTTTETTTAADPAFLSLPPPPASLPIPPEGVGGRGGRDFVKRLLVGTVFDSADPERIMQAARRYGRSPEEIETVIAALDHQYRRGTHEIGDPTALLSCALRDGVRIPEDYVPRATCTAEIDQRHEAARQKAEEKRRAEEAEETRCKAADERLLALPPEEYDAIMAQAKKRLPFVLRDSKKSLFVQAREILVSMGMAPEDFRKAGEACITGMS